MPNKDIEIRRQYAREWVRNKRNHYFSDKECTWCSSRIKLQIHHMNPSEKESHAVWSWSEERRNKELDKCIVLCQSCHKKYHDKLMTKPLIHGTINAYRNKNCRCELCKKAKREVAHLYWINKNRPVALRLNRD